MMLWWSRLARFLLGSPYMSDIVLFQDRWKLPKELLELAKANPKLEIRARFYRRGRLKADVREYGYYSAPLSLGALGSSRGAQ